jgi:hypothetical protein
LKQAAGINNVLQEIREGEGFICLSLAYILNYSGIEINPKLVTLGGLLSRRLALKYGKPDIDCIPVKLSLQSPLL